MWWDGSCNKVVSRPSYTRAPTPKNRTRCPAKQNLLDQMGKLLLGASGKDMYIQYVDIAEQGIFQRRITSASYPIKMIKSKLWYL